MLDFDTMLTHVGEFGIYQKALFLFQAPFCIFVTFITFGSLFMQIYPSQFYCADQFECNTGNLSLEQMQNLSLPFMISDVRCDLHEFKHTYLNEIAENERLAANQVCRNVSAMCIFNGSHWYSEPMAPGSLPFAHTGRHDRYIRSPQRYGGGSVTYPTSTTTEDYKYNENNYNKYGHNNVIQNPNIYGTQSGNGSPTGNPYGGNPNGGNNNYGNNPNGWNNQNGNQNSWNTQNPNENQNSWNTQNPNGNQNSWNYPNRNQNSWNNQYGNQNSWNNHNGNQNSWNNQNPNGNQNSWSTQNPNGNQNSWNNNGGNKYNPDDRDKYDNNQGGQGQNSNYGGGNNNGRNPPPRTTTSKPKNGESPGKQEELLQRQEKCRREDRVTTVDLLPRTRFVFNPHRSNLPIRGRTLEDCKNISWPRTIPGTNDRYYESIITEGKWWCNAEMYNTISQSVFFIGAIVGGFLIGFIADTFGRVPALVIANCIGAIGGILSTLTTNFYLFTFFRFITGMSFDNCFVMMYILVLEFCGPTYRTIVANLSIAIFYTIGTVILPWLALWLDNWRLFGQAIAAPMFLALIAIFIVPESSRWLLSKGRTKRATNILRRFAKVNGKKVDEKIFVEFEEGAQKLYEEISQEGPDPSLTEAFKTPRLRRTFILLVLIWSSIALVYDGHNRNILNLANAEWNLYWMFTLASLTEFPADILLILTLDKFGRRWLAFASLSLSGICSFIAATVPRDAWTATFVMAMLSRFWVNVSFNIGLQYASELLPTVIRAQGVNIIHIMGYVASLASPLIAQIGRAQPVLSLLLLGAVALGGGILSLFLSETLGEDLPNNLEEAEAFGKHQSFWNCPICAKPKPEEEEKVVQVPEAVKLRNSLRASSRGEMYRSSIISNPNRPSRFGIALDPFQVERAPLKRTYTR